ncbi:MAG: response regulator, partial [Verrucomicrobiota bacterium]|nr:response regulator [Verrucomicrobiota bacterium]
LTPENLARLFTPFERLGAEKSAIEGTGLGLSLCKRLIESMHGKIEVESAPGAGSTFSFELPRAEGADAPLEVDQPSALENRKTVLYIEDNLCYAELISETLKRRPGVKLLAATHGALGLDLARVHQPDLILLDLQLPDINGEEVLHELRGDARTSAVPVVVISGEASAGDVNRLLSAGASDYLDKPLDMPKFFATLDRVLELSPAAA